MVNCLSIRFISVQHLFPIRKSAHSRCSLIKTYKITKKKSYMQINSIKSSKNTFFAQKRAVPSGFYRRIVVPLSS